MIDWIKLSNDLPTHPKTLRLARALKVEEAGWYIFTLWCWCSKHCPDGVIRSDDPAAEVELAAGWRKKVGAFAAAAVSVGFLDRNDDGSLSVHDWWEWNGKAIAAARAKAEYLKKRREESRQNQKRTGSEPVQNQNGSGSVLGQYVESDVDVTRREKEKLLLQQPAALDLVPVDQRITGRELRDRWNAIAAPPSRLPPWETLSPAQEMQADVVAAGISRDDWATALELMRRSAYLNGHGARAFLLTPAKLLKYGAAWVRDEVLNGKYASANDLPPDSPPPEPEPVEQRRGVVLHCGLCDQPSVPGLMPLRCLDHVSAPMESRP